MIPAQSLLNHQHNHCHRHRHRHCHLATATATATATHPMQEASRKMKIMRDNQINLI
jgi:hypothetical protein